MNLSKDVIIEQDDKSAKTSNMENNISFKLVYVIGTILQLVAISLNYIFYIGKIYIAALLFGLITFIFFLRLSHVFLLDEDISPIFKVSTSFLTVFALIFGIGLYGYGVDKFYDEIETKLTKNNYTLYVNGEEIEPKNISIEKYYYTTYTVNDEEQKILISTQK